MSKSNIPICKLPDEECNVLFKSVIDKLKIQKPTFFYPIYKKLVNEQTNPEELQNFVLDSKYKCKEIIEKLIESDDEVFDTDEEDNVSSGDDQEQDTAFEKSLAKTNSENDNSDNEITEPNIESNTDVDTDIEHLLNEDIKDIPTEDENNFDPDENDVDAYENYDDKEIEEAISNTYMATAIIEKLNKETGQKESKEEVIHIKKTALLDPLKVMKDEYVIPSKVQNKNISDDTLKNTMNKLNSYNNCGHVESLFLYLGNKLVETGKCPSFPYYYGCVNGEDPNYHHNITDEYEAVSRTKWFKDRVKTDFDLLIIEDDDSDAESCNDERRQIRGPSPTISLTSSEGDGESESESESEDDKDQDLENPARKSSAKSCEDEDDNLKNIESEEKDEIIECTPQNSEDNELNLESASPSDLTFIKDMDLEDLCIDMDSENTDNTDTTITQEGGEEKCDDKSSKSCEESCNNDCNDSCNAKCDESCDDNCTKCIDIDNDSFIEELSDVGDNLSITDFEDKPGNMYYIKCENMPVSLSLMEKLDDTLDNVLDDDYNMSETEWFSVFFQVSFGLAVAQKYFNFVHNDLHSSNVMFKKTLLRNLYFQVGNSYYCIPTYGKITKIIDFARGTFKFGDRWVFSDQFKEDGDAHGQYDYPVDGSLKNCEHKPNPSFDLVRLGTTVIQRLEDVPKVREFVEQITLDDYDNSVCYDDDTFDLYIDIARNCHKAVPLEVMERKEFERFRISKTKIPKGQYVFKY